MLCHISAPKACTPKINIDPKPNIMYSMHALNLQSMIMVHMVEFRSSVGFEYA